MLTVAPMASSLRPSYCSVQGTPLAVSVVAMSLSEACLDPLGAPLPAATVVDGVESLIELPAPPEPQAASPRASAVVSAAGRSVATRSLATRRLAYAGAAVDGRVRERSTAAFWPN